jgi:small subunit ribosomal protein S9
MDEEKRTQSSSMTRGSSEDAHPAAEDAPPPKSWREEEMELAEQVKSIQDEKDAKKMRWLETAKPPVRKPIIDDRGRAYGRGGRKTAAARVWIQPGLGLVVVNRKDFVDYFDRTTDRELVLAPFTATGTCGKFDLMATVEGGGLTGQAGAIRHGLARALNHYNPDLYRPPLKRLGYLTRDPRKVERKKVGHIKARKKPQWVKR